MAESLVTIVGNGVSGFLFSGSCGKFCVCVRLLNCVFSLSV